MYRLVRINRNPTTKAVESTTELERHNSPTELICRHTTDKGLPNTFVEVPGKIWMTTEPFGAAHNRPDEMWITDVTPDR
jgi:hypothetical protein